MQDLTTYPTRTPTYRLLIVALVRDIFYSASVATTFYFSAYSIKIDYIQWSACNIGIILNKDLQD